MPSVVVGHTPAAPDNVGEADVATPATSESPQKGPQKRVGHTKQQEPVSLTAQVKRRLGPSGGGVNAPRRRQATHEKLVRVAHARGELKGVGAEADLREDSASHGAQYEASFANLGTQWCDREKVGGAKSDVVRVHPDDGSDLKPQGGHVSLKPVHVNRTILGVKVSDPIVPHSKAAERPVPLEAEAEVHHEWAERAIAQSGVRAPGVARGGLLHGGGIENYAKDTPVLDPSLAHVQQDVAGHAEANVKPLKQGKGEVMDAPIQSREVGLEDLAGGPKIDGSGVQSADLVVRVTPSVNDLGVGGRAAKFSEAALRGGDEWAAHDLIHVLSTPNGAGVHVRLGAI